VSGIGGNMKWLIFIILLFFSVNLYAKESKQVTKYFNSVYITESGNCYYSNTKGRTFTKISLDNAKIIAPKFFDVNYKMEKVELSINLITYPNPCKNNLNISINSENEALAKIYLMDENNCQLIFQGTMNEGLNDMYFDISQANKGLQIICLEINDKKYFQKIIKM
jgi:hypothetical protein